MSEAPSFNDTDIAVIGMAGKFPGAPDVDTLWQRVLRGDDCLDDLSAAVLAANGVPPSVYQAPEYVARNGLLPDIDLFDPEFFGIGARDASIMDPQHRHFMETAWNALEAAGIVPSRFEGSIGVFAGCGMDTYLINNLLSNPQLFDQMGWFLIRHTSNDKDFLATTLSYRLDLRGPSVNVQTACSTSLVAVHLAVQSLVSFECDVALAGGSTIESPHGVGYHYQEGEILSPDGRCRAYDRGSNGTVLTSGVGVVALRRAADAWEDGDPILAVIKGSAVNNDGARKVSYLAPSVDGHADAVKEALAVAGLSARDIGLVDGHGTGTAVGDPIEFAALSEAFRASTDDNGFCRLTSTKPNIGHLDTAAGVASMIKVVQALRHRTLPPLANFTGPSALLDVERSPFELSGTPAPWPADRVRRAGVSSLGVGGTNAHVVLEEGVERISAAEPQGEKVLLLSALSDQAVDDYAQRLADHLEAHAGVSLADVAYTLSARRAEFSHRRVIAAADREQAIVQLRTFDRNRSARGTAVDPAPGVAFLFPGGGSQYAGMGAGLDARFATYHEVMADGVEQVRALLDVDLVPLLQPDADPVALNAPTVSLPSVFLTSVALARQWMAFGVQPDALIGHSLGEYVAAHLAGVLSFDDALRLVTVRARLMEQVGGDAAAMLVVPLPEAEVRALIDDGVSLAVVNADDECVLAGRRSSIDAINARLDAHGTPGSLIPLAAAAHSLLLDPVLDEFEQAVRATSLRPPTMRYMSNRSGTWITAAEATDPMYWVGHLRNTVRYADNLRTALGEQSLVTVELGPGHTLSSYARRCSVPPAAAIAALRHPRQDVDDTAYTLQAFAQQWAAGVPVDVEQFNGGRRHTVVLPTYAFQKQRYWIEPGEGMRPPAGKYQAVETDELVRIADIADMCWAPRFTPATLGGTTAAVWRRWWLVAENGNALAESLADELVSRNLEVQRVASVGEVSSLVGDDAVLLVGSVGEAFDVDAATTRWVRGAVAAARAAGQADQGGQRIAFVTHGALGVNGTAAVDPASAMAVGAARVIPREYPDVSTVLVDLLHPAANDVAAAVDELVTRRNDAVVAVRDGQRLLPSVEHTPFVDDAQAASFVSGGLYLVTGGLGAIGHTLAKHLAERYQARLAVVTSSPLPAGSERASWLATHGPHDPTSIRVQRLAELEALGSKVDVVVADVADPAALTAALDALEMRHGTIDGAIHAAGNLSDQLIELVTDRDIDVVVGAKARGAVTLATELERRGASVLVLVSSSSTLLAPAGQLAYVASNAVLDSLAGTGRRLRVVTLGFGVWSDIGMAESTARRARLGLVEGRRIAHPVFEEVIERPGGSIDVVGHLSTSQWLIDEHRLANGSAVLPGTGHVELMLAALGAAGRSEPLALRDVALEEALIVADGAAITVKASIVGDSVELCADGGPAIGWVVHSRATVAEPAASVVLTADVDQLLPGDPMGRQRERLHLGAHWSPTASLHVGDEAVGRMALPSAADNGLWRAHPALVDNAIGLAVHLVASELSDAQLLVPLSYGQVTSYTALPDDVVAVTRRVGEPGSFEFDIDLFATDGEHCVAVRSLVMWAVDTAAGLHHDASASSDVVELKTSLSELSASLGIHPDEGAALLERVVADGRPQLWVSSVDLDELLRRQIEPNAPPNDSPVGDQPPSVGGGSVTDRVGGVWCELLGVTSVQPGDNFFDLGGHSLIAIRLVSRLHKELGVRLQLTEIFEVPTLSAMADTIEQRMPASARAELLGSTTGAAEASMPAEHAPGEWRSLVPITTVGSGEPLYIVHGAGGSVMFLWNLARALSGQHAVYGFQAIGSDSAHMPDGSIEEMATRYLAELRAHSAGPYVLGGYSGGGFVALEMAKQLTALGAQVSKVLLFDSVPPGKAEPGRFTAYRNVVGNLLRHGPGPLRPYMRQGVKRTLGKVLPRFRDHTENLVPELQDDSIVNLYYFFTATAERYQVSSYPFDVTVFKADQVWPTQPDDYHWRRHVTGAFDVQRVPGHHQSMFHDVNVTELAAKVADAVKASTTRS
jgi:acyl transferase domain-containing protein/thioesterase domain-containing protein/acyl carrier protein